MTHEFITYHEWCIMSCALVIAPGPHIAPHPPRASPMMRWARLVCIDVCVQCMTIKCVCPLCLRPTPPFQEVFVFAIPWCTMDISNVPNAIEMCWSQTPDSGFLLLPLYDACLPLHIWICAWIMAFGDRMLRPIYRYRHCRFELQCELHCLMHVARGIVQHTIAYQISVLYS